MSKLRLPGALVPGGAVLAELEGGQGLFVADLELRCMSGNPARPAARGRVGQRQETTAGLQFLLSLPEDAPVSRPDARSPVYWELVVRSLESEEVFPVVVAARR